MALHCKMPPHLTVLGTHPPGMGPLCHPMIYRQWNRWVFRLTGQLASLRYNLLVAVIEFDPGKKDSIKFLCVK